MILIISKCEPNHNFQHKKDSNFVLNYFIMIDLQLLLSFGAQFHSVEKGDALFWEGDSCLYYYQVHFGQFKWVNLGEDGKEFIQRIIEPGQCIGELPLFDGGAYAASAFAITKSEVIRLPIEQFKELMLVHPELQARFLARLASMVRFKFFMNKEIAFDDPEKLILAVFDYFYKQKLYIDEKDNLVLLTRQQIADLTGLRVETVIRVIRNLNDKNILRIEDRKIYLNNLESHE